MPAPKDPKKYKIWKEKIRVASKKRWEDPEYCKRTSESIGKTARKLWADPEYRQRMNALHDKVTKRIWADPEYRKTQSELNRLKALKAWQDPEFRKMMGTIFSRRLREYWKDPKYREKMKLVSSKVMEKLWKDPKFREKIPKVLAQANKGRIPWNKNLTKETDERVMQTSKKNKGQIPWCIGLTKETDERIRLKADKIRGKHQPRELVEKRLRRRVPSSLEEKFSAIVKKYNLPYKFTGNGSFIIAHCNPDFINTNNEKIAVEVYSKYYKERDGRSILRWKHVRRQKFAKFGWKIIFFDETQVKEEIVLSALRQKI